MEVRIHLQKTLSAANRLPQGAALEPFQAFCDEELALARKGLQDLVESLLDLQQATLAQNPATQPLAGAKRKRGEDLDGLEDYVASMHDR
jgi:hypothetical protein